MPSLDGYGYGYEKFNRRAEDWAMVGVAALRQERRAGPCADVRVGLDATWARRRCGRPRSRRRCAGSRSTRERIAAAAEQAAEGTEPPGDLNATPDYKRHLARVLTRRALRRRPRRAEA